MITNCIITDTFNVPPTLFPITMITSSVPVSCNSLSDGQLSVVVKWREHL